MYWKDKDGNNYELPSHCVNSPIEGCYYGDVGALHQVERVLNPLVCYRGMAGMNLIELIGDNYYGL
jgi:hypothetical protein